MPEPVPQCAVCAHDATQRMSVRIGTDLAAVVPLCVLHARAVKAGSWALQVESHWGGPWIAGAQYRQPKGS